jgi:lipopolysaccharide/colanic/teichoic acid biosynthesis glycosyltransferase
MTTVLRPRTLVLFMGDVFFFAFSLWTTLALRALAWPDEAVLVSYALPFALLFAVWVLVYFVAGLYESRSIIFARRALSMTLLVAQIINVSIAALFFFVVPQFGIAPKTILLIYLAVSFVSVLLWRVFIFPWLGLQKAEAALVVGEGPEIAELVAALAAAHRAPAHVVATVAPSQGHVAEAISTLMKEHHPRFIIADFNNPAVAAAFPHIYNLLSRGVRFVDAMDLYEEVFGRVPLSQIDEQWLARNVSRYSHVLYDPVKMVMDFFGGLVLGSILLYPFICIAILTEDGFPIFIAQERVGEDNKLVRIYKFRSMSGNDNGKYGNGGATKLHVTRVGRFLRAWRLDELPQLWNIMLGSISLIGPRLEFPSLVEQYENTIPYYGVRHLIKPGLSGWAQLYHFADPHHAADVEATKMKLSYDLYYLKHRSLTLDIIIAIKTVRRMLVKGNA